MKLLIATATVLTLAGCATEGDQKLAQADCKVYPATTTSSTGRKPNVSPIEQRHAEMQLASSEYRMRNLRERGYENNNVEDALRDCSAR